jgi:hypothetical protein
VDTGALHELNEVAEEQLKEMVGDDGRYDLMKAGAIAELGRKVAEMKGGK